MKMEFDQASILATMSPVKLILGLGVMGIVGFYCARKYRNTNDFKKSSRLYGCLVIPGILLLLVFGLGLFLSIGICICGFIIMALTSNHYFHS